MACLPVDPPPPPWAPFDQRAVIPAAKGVDSLSLTWTPSQSNSNRLGDWRPCDSAPDGPVRREHPFPRITQQVLPDGLRCCGGEHPRMYVARTASRNRVLRPRKTTARRGSRASTRAVPATAKGAVVVLAERPVTVMCPSLYSHSALGAGRQYKRLLVEHVTPEMCLNNAAAQ